MKWFGSSNSGSSSQLHEPKLLKIERLDSSPRASASPRANDHRSVGDKVQSLHMSMADLSFATDASDPDLSGAKSLDHQRYSSHMNITSSSNPGGGFGSSGGGGGHLYMMNSSTLTLPKKKRMNRMKAFSGSTECLSKDANIGRHTNRINFSILLIANSRGFLVFF